VSAERVAMPQSPPAGRLAAFLKTALVFALVGPPAGWLIFAAGLFVFLPDKEMTMTYVAKSGVLFIVGLPLSNIIGGVPALIAGVLAGAARVRLRPPPIAYPASVGVAAALAFAFLFDRSESSAEMMPIWQYDGIKGLTCLLPFTLCWRLPRRFQMTPQLVRPS
jgi:hypothetical protein